MHYYLSLVSVSFLVHKLKGRGKKLIITLKPLDICIYLHEKVAMCIQPLYLSLQHVICGLLVTENMHMCDPLSTVSTHTGTLMWV